MTSLNVLEAKLCAICPNYFVMNPDHPRQKLSKSLLSQADSVEKALFLPDLEFQSYRNLQYGELAYRLVSFIFIDPSCLTGGGSSSFHTGANVQGKPIVHAQQGLPIKDENGTFQCLCIDFKDLFREKVLRAMMKFSCMHLLFKLAYIDYVVDFRPHDKMTMALVDNIMGRNTLVERLTLIKLPDNFFHAAEYLEKELAAVFQGKHPIERQEEIEYFRQVRDHFLDLLQNKRTSLHPASALRSTAVTSSTSVSSGSVNGKIPQPPIAAVKGEIVQTKNINDVFALDNKKIAPEILINKPVQNIPVLNKSVHNTPLVYRPVEPPASKPVEGKLAEPQAQKAVDKKPLEIISPPLDSFLMPKGNLVSIRNNFSSTANRASVGGLGMSSTTLDRKGSTSLSTNIGGSTIFAANVSSNIGSGTVKRRCQAKKATIASKSSVEGDLSQSVVVHEFETLKREKQSYKRQLILDKVEYLDVCLMALQSLPKDPSVILDKMSVHLANLKHLILEFTATSHT